MSTEPPIPQRTNGYGRRRRKLHQRAQPQISVSIGSLCPCALDHVAPRSPNGREEPTDIAQIPPERLLNDPYLSIEDSDDEDYVELFMTKDGNRRRPHRYAKSVKAFCQSETLQELLSNSPKLSSERTCLVDDMTNTGSSSTRLGVYEPLTTWEMYLKLKEKRFHPITPVVVLGKLNADRRLSFIANPDPYAIAAIMTTAPKIEDVPLIDFFYYYISFLPDIRFSKTPRGYMNVVQQFHLPFYSWRSTRQEPKDNRLKTDKSPLRKVHNVQFLRGEPSDPTSEIDYLCEAQISVLITAINRRIWTGYCFVDTYYQEESQKQSVGDYCKDDLDEDGLQTDPFTNGECDSNKPILDPDHYFLTALDSQLRVCYFEWTDTAHQIRTRVQQYINKFASSSPKLQSSSFEEDEEPSEWLCQTRHMLTLLVESLDNTIHCLDNYACKDHNLSPYEHRCFECIRQTISDLKICLRELRGVLTWCDEHERALNLRNIDAQKKVSRLQITSAQHNQTATYFLLYIVSPITVAAAMLSMQEKAIPSILGPNKSSFIVLAPVLGVLVAALARLIHSRESILPALGEWVQRWQMKRQLDRDIELEDV